MQQHNAVVNVTLVAWHIDRYKIQVLTVTKSSFVVHV